MNDEMLSLSGEVVQLINSNRVFSDIHIEQDEPLMIRTPAGWVGASQSLPVMREDIEALVSPLVPDWLSQIQQGKAVKIKMEMAQCRLRCLLFTKDALRRLVLTIRRQPVSPLSFAAAGLPSHLEQLCEHTRGLVLVTGPTGSGKTTAVTSFLEAINKRRRAHIVTIEDPIEYELKREQSIITQKEVGVDTPNFAEGLREAVRQRPDVIMIGEIRDRETADTAIRAGASGHLVFGTLHAPSVPAAVSELLSYLPDEIRASRANTLSQCLLAGLGLALLPNVDSSRYVLATEVLGNLRTDPKVIDAIAKEDMPELFEHMRRRSDGTSRLLNHSLKELVREKQIRPQDAISATYNSTELQGDLREINGAKA